MNFQQLKIIDIMVPGTSYMGYFFRELRKKTWQLLEEKTGGDAINAGL